MINLAARPRPDVSELVEPTFVTARLVLRPSDRRILNQYAARINRAVGFVAHNGQVCSRAQRSMVLDFHEYLTDVCRFSSAERLMVASTAAHVVRSLNWVPQKRDEKDYILLPSRRWEVAGRHVSLRVGTGWLGCSAEIDCEFTPVHGWRAMLRFVDGEFELVFPGRPVAPKVWIPEFEEASFSGPPPWLTSQAIVTPTYGRSRS